MKRLLLFIVMSCWVAVGFAQVATDGDYRSIASGDWSATTTWQTRVAGAWQAATAAPTSANNVYLQTGHTINIDMADVNCKDLHWGFNSTVYGAVKLNTSNLNVSGKVRVYTGHSTPIVATGADGTFYSAQVSSTATSANQFNSSTTLGYLKFVGNTRDITLAGEWNGNGTVCYGVFALNAGQTGTINTGMKFRGLDIVSGTIVSNNGALAIGSTTGTGILTIQNGAKLISSRSTQVITQSSTAACETVDIQTGGVLELTNSNPEINCNNFINNGTVIYSGTNQNLAKTLIAGANSLSSYANLTVSCSTSLNLPENAAITLSGSLNFTNGNLLIPATSSLTLQNGNAVVAGTSASSYIQTLTSGANIGVLKVTGLSTANTFPVGSATSFLPVTLNPSTSSNFNISVFTGATTNGTPNGTPLTAAQKLRMVDAVWNVVRTSGSGNADLTLGWPNSLEGADFSAFGNTSIGIANYNSGVFGAFTGPGNAAANTATINTANFSAFIVGEANTTLPLTLLGFTAKQNLNTVRLDWKTSDEKDLKNYILQHKKDDGYETIQTFAPNNKPGIFNYSFTHATPLAGTNYYRLLAVDLDGTTYTFDQQVKVSLNNAMNVYPNPAVGNVITVSGVVKGDVIRLQNIQGQVIAKKVASGSSEQIDVQAIAMGTYIVSIENEGKTVSTKKIIKI